MPTLPDDLHTLPLKDIKKFVNANFPLLGKGTGRRVYDLGDGSVIKVAINEWGRQQLHTENDGWFSGYGHDDVFNTPITDPYDCDYNYAVYPKAETTNFHENFKAFSGVSWKAFRDRVLFISYDPRPFEAQHHFADTLMALSHDNTYNSSTHSGKPCNLYEINQWSRACLSEEFGEWCSSFGDTLASAVTLALGDFRTKSSFGFVNGKLKVIDFGCEVYALTKWQTGKSKFRFQD